MVNEKKKNNSPLREVSIGGSSFSSIWNWTDQKRNHTAIEYKKKVFCTDG